MTDLTLRPTGLRNSAAFAHLADWSVIEDGQEIGRIYEVHAPVSPDVAWFWSVGLPGPPGLPTHGRAPTFDAAKAEFQCCLAAMNARPG